MSSEIKQTEDSFLNRVPEQLDSALMGCYILTHIPSGCFYIGSTRNYAKRQGKHISELRRNVHGNTNLQCCYNEKPIFSFNFFLTAIRYPNIKPNESDVALHYQMEQTLLDQYRGDPFLLNVATDANLAGKGIVPSEETRAKQSLAASKRTYSDEHVERLRTLGSLKKKPIIIEGTQYAGIRDAAKMLKMSKTSISFRIKSKTFKDWNYVNGK